MCRIHRMQQHRMPAMRTGLLGSVRRRRRQMMAGSTPHDVERADPVGQSEVNGRGCRTGQHDYQHHGEHSVDRHDPHLRPHPMSSGRIPQRYSRQGAGNRVLRGQRAALSLARALVDLLEFFAADAHALGLEHLVDYQRAAFATGLTATALLLRRDVGELRRLQWLLSSFRVRVPTLPDSSSLAVCRCPSSQQ